MDCTPFIRTKRVLACWLLAPLILVLLVEFGSQEYYNRQRISCEQHETVFRVVPLLRTEADYAQRFLESYAIDLGHEASVEDVYIARINQAAQESGLLANSINLEKESIDPDLGIAKITIRLKGSGTCRQTAEFLKKLKTSDPLIVENRLLTTPIKTKGDALQIDAEFVRIYAE